MTAATPATAAQPAPGPDRADELEQIFTAHHSRVFRAAYRITGNASDAEDVLQTVFLRLARQGWTQGVIASIESYLHRAAVNAALDVVRMRRDARMIPADELAGVLAEDSRQEPERRRQSSELRELVRRAVSHLSPRAAEIFALRYFEELSNKEIAAILDVSQTDVAVSLHRSRTRLQQEIRSHLGERS